MLKLFTNRLIGRKPVISLLFNQQLGIKCTTSTFLSNQRQAATFGLRTFAGSSVVSEEGDGDRGRKEADNISEEKGSRNQQERWDYMVKQLIVYREEHGDTLVSCEYEANPRLGTWVDNQRQQYRRFKQGIKSLLNEERIKQLEQEEFVWDAHSLTWEQNCKDLVAYKNKYGDCNIPKNMEGYEALSMWALTQKQMYSKRNSGKPSSITDERIEALEAIGFVWGTTHDEAWNTRFEELKLFKAYHGHCLVPAHFPSNPRLANWVDLQRTQCRKRNKLGQDSLLTDERIHALEEIGFVFKVNDYKWNKQCEELESFKEVNGHCNVPYKRGIPLARWVRRQKAEYNKLLEGKKTTMSEYRKEKLKKIGFITE